MEKPKKATLAIIVKDGKVLLGEKKRGEIGAGTLNGPGGKVDSGETATECLVRETKEELDILLLPEKLEHIAHIMFYAAGKQSFEVDVYYTNYFEGELKETADMIPKMYPIDALPFAIMLESDRHWFPRAVRKQKFRANVYYKEKAKDFEHIEFFPY